MLNSNVQHLLLKRAGLLQLALLEASHTQIAQSGEGMGLLLPQHAREHRPQAFEQGQGCGNITLPQPRVGQVVYANERLGVFGAQHRAGQRHGLLFHGQGRGIAGTRDFVTAQPVVQTHAVERLQHGRKPPCMHHARRQLIPARDVGDSVEPVHQRRGHSFAFALESDLQQLHGHVLHQRVEIHRVGGAALVQQGSGQQRAHGVGEVIVQRVGCALGGIGFAQEAARYGFVGCAYGGQRQHLPRWCFQRRDAHLEDAQQVAHTVAQFLAQALGKLLQPLQPACGMQRGQRLHIAAVCTGAIAEQPQCDRVAAHLIHQLFRGGALGLGRLGRARVPGCQPRQHAQRVLLAQRGQWLFGKTVGYARVARGHQRAAGRGGRAPQRQGLRPRVQRRHERYVVQHPEVRADLAAPLQPLPHAGPGLGQRQRLLLRVAQQLRLQRRFVSENALQRAVAGQFHLGRLHRVVRLEGGQPQPEHAARVSLRKVARVLGGDFGLAQPAHAVQPHRRSGGRRADLRWEHQAVQAQQRGATAGEARTGHGHVAQGGHRQGLALVGQRAFGQQRVQPPLQSGGPGGPLAGGGWRQKVLGVQLPGKHMLAAGLGVEHQYPPPHVGTEAPRVLPGAAQFGQADVGFAIVRRPPNEHGVAGVNALAHALRKVR